MVKRKISQLDYDNETPVDRLPSLALMGFS